jgi:hypothetical protein
MNIRMNEIHKTGKIAFGKCVYTSLKSTFPLLLVRIIDFVHHNQFVII